MVRMGLKTHIGAHGEPPLGLNYHAEMFFTKAGGLTNYEASHPHLLPSFSLMAPHRSVLAPTFHRARLLTGPGAQNDILTIWLAVIALFTIDFSINAGKP